MRRLIVVLLLLTPAVLSLAADPPGESQKSKKDSPNQPSSMKKGQPRKLPPAAKAHGYTKCVIDEKPVAEDVASDRTGDHKWFSGDWWNDQPTLDHYKNARGKLAISVKGCLVNHSRDFKPSKIPFLPGADGFYVEFDVQLSDDHPAHFPSLTLMPNEHNWGHDLNNYDHYPGDPERFERWMELDIDEGGLGPGMCGGVFSSSGISPDYKHIENPNRVSKVPLQRSKMHTFGAAYDPKRPAVSWWLDGKFMTDAGPPAVPEVAAKQNFYMVITANNHGQEEVPYTMYIGGVRAFVPPTSKLPEVDVAAVKPKKNGGTIALTVSEQDANAQVLTDDGQIEDTRLVEKKSESIVVNPGKYQLKVWKDGFELFTDKFQIDAGGKKSITAKLAPVVKKTAGSTASQETWKSPAFQKWLEDAIRLPGEKQLEAVSKKLMELNPGFYGKLTALDGHSVPRINEHNNVIEVKIVTDYVSDISPVRAFHQLWKLECSGSSPGKGYLSDLSPLKGMNLTHLNLWGTQVKDLSPLEGMPIEMLSVGHTPVSDLSRLKLSRLNRFGSEPLKSALYCDNTPISDVSPLQGLQLQSILFTPKNITKGIDVIRQMKSIESIGAAGHAMTTPDEFWKKYDAGEFRKSK